jgi:sigma-B regulation protein RsbU (phosphoserine phosphatase)
MAINTEQKLKLREMELESLFETINLINSNARTGDLFKVFRYILSSNPNVEQTAIFVAEEGWRCVEKHGTKSDLSKVILPEKFLSIKNWQEGEVLLKNCEHFSEFQLVLPIYAKNKLKALIFIGYPENLDDLEKLDINFIQTLGNIVLVAAENKKLAEKEKERETFNRQLEIAKQVQTLLFPKKLPNSERLSVFASYQPHHTVGGDYYDFIQINETKFLMCVADVSGKGIPAAILMSNFQAALRTLVRQTDDLKKIVHELNFQILDNSNGENFITAFLVTYDFESKTMAYVNAGHNPPLLFKDKSNTLKLSDGTTILGAFNPLPFLSIQYLHNLDSFLLFCFTDGFTETSDENGVEFGENSLEEFIHGNLHLPQGELHKALLEYLDKFKGKSSFADDLTLLSCRVKAH